MMTLSPRFRALRVLCVEEDAVQRKLMEVCLGFAGTEVFFAAKPQQALALFRRHPVDMIFLDFDQHSEEELAVFRIMRDKGQRGRHVPILAVTNNDCRWSRAAYREAGFAGLFEKPVEPMRLFRTMDGILCEVGQPPLLERGAGYAPQWA
jgi:CheY-like chemotaxis protein